MIVEDSVNPNTLQVLALAFGVLVALAFYFSGYSRSYREFRGGLWIEMKKVGSPSVKRWRQKRFLYFGIWKGWSGWEDSGQTHATVKYRREKSLIHIEKAAEKAAKKAAEQPAQGVTTLSSIDTPSPPSSLTEYLAA